MPYAQPCFDGSISDFLFFDFPHDQQRVKIQMQQEVVSCSTYGHYIIAEHIGQKGVLQQKGIQSFLGARGSFWGLLMILDAARHMLHEKPRNIE